MRAIRAAEISVHLALGAVAGLLLYALGRPIFTDDLWLHLALGQAYAGQGPWLVGDPTLFTAAGPPDPASWLADVTLYAAQRTLGFGGLRFAHAAIVASILALAWSCLRRASGSRLAASLGTSLFAVLAAYRLFQLRPELATILATLILYRLILEDSTAPSRARIALAALLCALWVNLHAGFLLGPVWVAVAAAGLVAATPLRADRWRAGDRARAIGLGVAAAVTLMATLANPDGPSALAVFFRAGDASPALGVVVDEWSGVNPFRLPVANLPPSPLAWSLVWGLLILTPCAAYTALRHARRSDAGAAAAVDPVLIALAAASLASMLFAVRFLWLAIFPLLLLAQTSRVLGARRPQLRASAAVAVAIALVPGFLWLGDWSFLTGGIRMTSYREPYDARKYFAHSAWFLRDAEVTGHLYASYNAGAFYGYWLAPDLKGFINGSLNVPGDVMPAYQWIQRAGGDSPETGIIELLDEYEVDVFVGTGLPAVPPPHRPRISTSSHLERAAGWTLVFRSLSSSVYLRANERNRSNLDRIAAYYESQGVPFDRETGFDTERVLREKRDWAIYHGLGPRDYVRLVRASFGLRGSLSNAAVFEPLAGSYAALGLYERALEIDRRALAHDAKRVSARRRVVWSLLRLDRATEALAEAEVLAEREPDLLSQAIADAAQRYATLESTRGRDSLVALLPVFTRPQAFRLTVRSIAPAARLEHP